MCTVLLPPGGNPIAVNKYIMLERPEHGTWHYPIYRTRFRRCGTSCGGETYTFTTQGGRVVETLHLKPSATLAISRNHGNVSWTPDRVLGA